MSRIFWDTNLFIYLFEGTGVESDMIVALRQRMKVRGDELLTSALTLAKILVKPKAAGKLETCELYEQAIRTNARVIPFDQQAAKIFATIRSHSNPRVHPADAIQIACAAAENTDLFVTNDRNLHGLHVPGIQFIAPLDRVPV